jgi:hypothetical protein
MDSLEQLAQSGDIRGWVEWQCGEWDHRDWLVLLAQATARYGPLPADCVGLLLEEEKKRYWERLAAEERETGFRIHTRKQLEQTRETLKRRWDVHGFDGLFQVERDWIVIWWLKVEVGHGRFDHYFSNPAGDGALLALAALGRLEQTETHHILSDALACFGPVGGYNPEREVRQERLRRLPGDVFEKQTDAFHSCSEAADVKALLWVRLEYLRLGIK